jgi:hypothetical protein
MSASGTWVVTPLTAGLEAKLMMIAQMDSMTEPSFDVNRAMDYSAFYRLYPIATESSEDKDKDKDKDKAIFAVQARRAAKLAKARNKKL